MRVLSASLLLLVASAVDAFSTSHKNAFSVSQQTAQFKNDFSKQAFRLSASLKDDEMDAASVDTNSLEMSTKMASMTAGIWVLSASITNAAGPDWGIFEGRIGSMLHPITMAGLLGLSVYTGILGLQWRRQRTIGDDINELKKGMPSLGGASSISDAIANAKAAETVDMALVAQLEAAIPIESEISALKDERKELSSKGLRDKHFSQGAILAFLGTAFAIEGPLNTYARAGKLFPGPHLYAGAGLVVLWALAAASVPFMQKGNETARTVHIGANLVGVGLFGWQVVSGIPIMLKVIDLTKWP